MIRACRALLWVALLAVAGICRPAAGQAAAAFEVSTVKPSDPARCCRRWIDWDGRHFTARNATIAYLLQWSYGLNDKQILGAPEWLGRNHFDIAGETESGVEPTDWQWRQTVQTLLADRFQLRVHHERRAMTAYVLTVLPGGPKFGAKFKRLDPDQDKPEDTNVEMNGWIGDTMQVKGTDATIADLVGELGRMLLARPLVDQTGLKGRFNFELAFTREQPDELGATELDDDAAPNLFKALERQMGLHLAVRRAAVDVIVIDRVAKPEEN